MSFAIEHEQAYEGPSLWLDRPVVRIVLRCGADSACPARLQATLEHLGASLDRARYTPLSLPRPPVDGTIPWWLGWGAIGLQRLAGDDVGYFFAQTLEPPGSSEVVVECRHRQTGLLAVRLAVQQIISLTADRRTSFDLEGAFARQLALVAASRRPDSTRGCILDAARARGIPIASIDPRGRVQELGTGIYRRRLFNATTSNTSAIGAWISGDKKLSLHYLRECGLPVPETAVARNPELAVERARKIGFPVVVKPIGEGDAAGVHVDLRTDDEVRAAFADAAAMSRSGTVVVQRFLVGKEYRFLVVGNKIVAAIHRVPAHVVGDGTHTIRELVEIENRSARRGRKKSDRLKAIEIGLKTIRMLERQGLGPEDVPTEGMRVQLNPTGHITAGGEAIEMTAAVHLENTGIVLAAARALEVDIAGIDVIAEDIERPIWETSGGIVEVNCGPGFWIHQFPSSGADIDPGPAVIETLFPAGAPVRVPVVAVTGGRETHEISRLIGRLLTAAGRSPGIVSAGELFLGETHLGGIDGRGIAGKRRILLNSAVELAVLEVTPEEIVEDGLAFDVCDVAVVTSLGERSFTGFPPVESVVCRTLSDEGVLVVPGEDQAMVEFASEFDRLLVLYEEGGPSPSMEAHLRRGGRAVILRTKSGERTLDIFDGSGLGSTLVFPPDMMAPSHVELAAIAAVVGLGYSAELLERLIQHGDGYAER